MSSLSFRQFLQTHKELIEQELKKYIEQLNAPAVLKEAMDYSLQAGGKRIRPMLVFSVLDALGKDTSIGLPVACSIEMIHTYSLIHDDLPGMDNDSLRRGKPTNHIVFGEANAILAGDALLTLSFGVLSEMNQTEVTAEQQIAIMQVIAQCAGAEGMIGGQTVDMASEGKTISLEELEYIHEHKTGKLLSASIITGAILGGADNDQLDALRKFSKHLGLAFQIRDDILDVEGNEELIGKPVGSDVDNNKSTYPALLTLNGAKEKLAAEINQAIHALESIRFENSYLMDLTKLVAERNM
ncbi:polyprenyl synthetase family protein [Bacillus sp. AGMB 02131]|uniref:Farnesyl diphosphate synthase n=1 Tax=Peribacillus faecalis TaxID=2772559 RepID=A0A927CWL2_9BACI|nr:farnesyl diphosphate synthase [Peribacillus faecalis]MBD3108087.1 polyprenyl synthetase family protein [Peribacillus faecalis]